MNSIKHFFLGLLALMAGLSSCTDLTGTFEDFQGDGEITYSGKIDSLVIKEGLNKIQVEGFLYYAGTAKEAVIQWEDQQKIVSLDGYSKNDRLAVLVDNLKEGLYVFKVFTLDKDKNRSVISTLQANVYGEKFIAAQNPVSYTATFTERNTVEIEWADIPKLSKAVLEYTDNQDNLQQIDILPENAKTVIYKFKPGTSLKITTYVKPSEKALEYIPLKPEYYKLPDELYDPEMIDRRLFKNMAMASDAKQNHGGVVENMWDGNDETYMHTTDNLGVPCHITLDTGEENYLTEGKITMRSIFIWCPSQFQIWGLPDVEDINAHEPSVKDDFNNKDAWETESKAKGWINLTEDGNQSYAVREANNRIATFKLNGTKKVRYIRYRAIKVWEREADTNKIMEGYGAYFCTSELYLYRGI
ncbi:DUF4998 domain-containing protein [Bacteroides sp.]|uniref:DUF4998 domain-containing protein n=1 Tax=Bacteroides sp. TaxID=29523 RepID=UPI00261B6CBA|nr:DUF4998 domain-containing protein [Bacteroides sp.]MDD3036548.1 DUF4998 domain-containing protein [Bacteroides sp.]